MDIENLNKNLKNVQGLKYKDAELSESNKIESLPAKVEVDEYEVEIKENGEIGIKEKEDGTGGGGGESEVTPGEVNALIGQTVDYKDKSGGKVDAWRVFYASNTEMFLISSNTIDSKTAFGASSNGIPLQQKTTNKDYTDATKTKIVIDDIYGSKYNETYNSKWYAYGMTDMNGRSKATAYLCDSKNWTDYVGENAPSGTYTVGGPTKELLVRSWVASGQTKGEKEEDLKAMLDDTEVSDAGYTYNKPKALYTKNPILTTILPDENNKGLYNTGDNYWLASPSSLGSRNVCYVASGGCVLSNDYSYTSYGVRPLVSIPMSKVQIKDGKVTIGNN